jgi:hypothetical protein
VSISFQQTIHYFVGSFRIRTAANHVPQQVSVGLGGSGVSDSFCLNVATLACVFEIRSLEFCVRICWFSFFRAKLSHFYQIKIKYLKKSFIGLARQK